MAAPETPSKRTFLIRRLVALAVVVGLIWAVVAGVTAVVGWVGGLFGGSKPAVTASAGTSAGNDSANAASAKYTTCMPKGIDLMAVVGDGSKPQSSFAAATSPKFWFVVTNTSDKPCYYNVGTKAQVYKVTSGSETIWSNADCKAAVSNYRMLLQPGVSTTSPAITWDRVHSSATGCDRASGQGIATGGGASYHLQVTLNGVASNDVQFILN
ncbi:MAG: hypothetical protein RJA35_809 [Actinomycetota bacterium]